MLWHRLGVAMGEPDIEALQERITSRQFTRWIAFCRIDPFGEQRMDARFAMLITCVARMLGDKNARMEKFMLFPDAGSAVSRRETMEAWERWKAGSNSNG